MPALSFDDLVPQASPPQGASAPSGPLSFDDLVPKQEPSMFENLSGGIQRGLTGTGIGLLQTANDVGKLYGNMGKSPAQQQADEIMTAKMNAAAQNVQNQGKDTGFTGTVGEAIGNPENWGPWKSMLAMGGAEGLTAPQANDNGLGGRAVQGAIDAPIAAATGKLAGFAAKPLQSLANKTGLTDLITGALQKFGANDDPGDLYKLAQGAGLEVTGKTPQEIADSLKGWYNTQAQQLSGGVSTAPHEPVAAAQGIAQNWTAAQQAANDAYKAAKTTGADIQQPIEGLPQKLDTMIGALEGNTAPGTKEHAALAQLKYIRDQIAPETTIPARSVTGAPSQDLITKPGTSYQPDLSGMNLTAQGEPLPGAEGAVQRVGFQPVETPGHTTTFPASTAANIDFATGKPVAPQVSASDLIDLRANLNQAYNPKKLPDRAMLPANAATNDVRGALQATADANPEFGKQLTAADEAQAYLGQTYKKNDLLKSFFKPEDLAAFEQNARNGTALPDITLQRANQMLSKVSTPEQLNTLTKAMPQAAGDALRAAKIQSMFDQAGFNAKQLAAPDFARLMQQALGNDPEALAQFGKVQQLAEALERRGLNPMAPQIGQGHLDDSLMRAGWDALEGRKRYAIRMAIRWASGQKSGFPALQQEIQQGAPFAGAIQGAAQQLAPRAATQEMNQGSPAPATGGIGDQNMQELQRLRDQMQAAPQPQASTAPLDKIAEAESGGNPNAQNPNSSASGPYQFTDPTWATMVKKYGKDTGIALADKNNAQAQAIMTKLYARDNIQRMTPLLGRQPTLPEVYMAHVFGADGASRLIQAQGSGKQAIMLYPKAVTSANRSLFFDGAQPRTVEQLYALLSQKVS